MGEWGTHRHRAMGYAMGHTLPTAAAWPGPVCLCLGCYVYKSYDWPHICTNQTQCAP